MRWKPGTAVILGLLGIAAAFFTSYSYQAITAVAPYERIEGQPTIVIDAGHGGFDGGKGDQFGDCIEFARLVPDQRI